MSIEEYWCAGEDDLRDDYEPDFDATDTVCFKDWPDFTYEVSWVDGDKTWVWDGELALPTAALRKVIEEPKPARPDPEEQEVDVDSELTVAELKALEALAGVNHEVRGQ